MLRGIVLAASVIGIFGSSAEGREDPRLEVTLESADYLLGEPVVLRVEITNIGSESLIFLSDPGGWGPYWKVSVSDGTGKQLAYQGRQVFWAPPDESTLYQLSIGQRRVFDYNLDGNFDLSVAGTYTVGLSYDASRELKSLRAGNPTKFAEVSGVSASVATARFQVIAPEGDEAAALDQLFSTREGKRLGSPLLRATHLQRFLTEYPASAYAPYARFWLAQSLSPGLANARLQHHELVRNTASRRWLRAAAQYEIARIYEQLNRPADAIAAYKTLRADFPDSPISQKAEERIRAMGAVLAKPQS